MRRLQLLFLVLGIGLFVYVVEKAGLGRVALGLYTVGWSFVAVFLIELVIDLLHSEGWRWCIPHERGAVSRVDIFLARTAGVAVNVLTPTATVGGEVVKGMLLRRWIPLTDGFASVVVDKLSFALGQAVFLCCGAFAVLAYLSFDTEERILTLGGLALWISAVVAFFALQRAGMFRVGLGAVRTIFGGSAFVEKLPGDAESFDAKVMDFLRDSRGALGVSVLFHLLAQLARVPQYYVVMSALGLRPTIATAFTTAAGLVFMEATMFLIPAKLGVFEGGNALIFSRLGYGVAPGIVVSFTMRLSELASALLGLAAMAYYHLLPDDVASVGSTPPPDTEVGDRPQSGLRTRL
jgi:uncharacterized protein (TIRG00374 family)